MARGRLLNNAICGDKKIHDLSSDTSRLAFTWALSHLDRDGRITGDPIFLKSLIFPRRTDITPEMMESFIQEWAESKIVIWYEVDGDKILEFTNFRKNQVNLRYDREPESIYPPPSLGKLLIIEETLPETIRNNTGSLPEESRKSTGEHPAEVKRREVKLREENSREGGAREISVAELSFQENELFGLMRNTFEKKHGPFGDLRKQHSAILTIIGRSRSRASPETQKDFITGMIKTFKDMHENDKFFKRKPFTPASMVSFWDQILEKFRVEFEDDYKKQRAEEEARAFVEEMEDIF